MSIELDMFQILARNLEEETAFMDTEVSDIGAVPYNEHSIEQPKEPKPNSIDKYYDFDLDQLIFLYLEDIGNDKIITGISEDGKKRAQVKLHFDTETQKYIPGSRSVWIDWQCNGGYFGETVRKYLRKNNLYKEPNLGKKKNISFSKPEFTEEEKDFFGEPEDVFNNLIATEPIGSGGFRNVYDLGDFVLKIANNGNSWDLAKKVNRDESNFKMQAEFPNVTVKTYKYDPDFAWIIQDKVKDLDDIEYVEDYFFPNHHPFKEHLVKLLSYLDQARASEEIQQYTPQAIELGNLVKKYNIDIKDLKPQNFGETANGRIVLIDIGVHVW